MNEWVNEWVLGFGFLCAQVIWEQKGKIYLVWHHGSGVFFLPVASRAQVMLMGTTKLGVSPARFWSAAQVTFWHFVDPSHPQKGHVYFTEKTTEERLFSELNLKFCSSWKVSKRTCVLPQSNFWRLAMGDQGACSPPCRSSVFIDMLGMWHILASIWMNLRQPLGLHGVVVWSPDALIPENRLSSRRVACNVAADTIHQGTCGATKMSELFAPKAQL